MAGQQAGIAVSVLHWHPALISQADDDLGPVQALAGQLLQERHRAAAARQHHTGLPLGGNRGAQALSHIMSQGHGQCLGIRQFMSLHGRWQFQFRYPHTTPSHRV
ncbi:hypothetical protein D3C76_1458730 [compost metagenome]